MTDILDDYAAWLARPVAHRVPAWTFETFHTPACREHLQDPGAQCICRDWSKPQETK